MLLTWALQRGVVPLLGPRAPDQPADNLGALEIALTPEHIADLEAASAISLGFPHEMNGRESNRDAVAAGHRYAIDPPHVAPR